MLNDFENESHAPVPVWMFSFEYRCKTEVFAQSFPLRYTAGHYLQLNITIDGQAHSLSYSVANRPDSKQPHRLQLFIQNGSLFTEKLLRRLVQLCGRQEHLSVTLPMGRAFLQSDLGQPHLLVAAGSGISKIKCLAEEIVARDATCRDGMPPLLPMAAENRIAISGYLARCRC